MLTDTLPTPPVNDTAAPLSPLVLEVEVEPHPTASPASIVWEGFVSLLVVAVAGVLGTILALFIGLFAGWIPIC